MVLTENELENTIVSPSFSKKITLTRIGIGLLQGIALYFVYQALKENSNPYVLFPFFWLSLFIPLIGISSLGDLNKRQISIWLMTLTTITGLLTLYAVWRTPDNSSFVYPHLFVAYPIFLYIAHSLVLASAFDKSYIASYPTYFEITWKLLIQLKFSLLFVGALFALLFLGSALFMLINLQFLSNLLEKSWFVIPTVTFAFAYAWHITDVKPALIRGIRTLLLTLLSWILPVAVLLVAGFLLSLVWTGLNNLWETRHATPILLSIAIVLILLINATFQNGITSAAGITQISAKIAACLLLPIAAIAIYSLGMRIDQYGWTDERVTAAAMLLITSCYAVGYLWAACQRGMTLQRIAKVNVINALIVLVVALALLSPIADPTRISVNSQMHRLLTGKISVNEFDFKYLKFEGGRYGLKALEQLKNISNRADAPQIREEAGRVSQQNIRQNKDKIVISKQALQKNLTIWPETMRLPDSFLQQSWTDQPYYVPDCLTTAGSHCDVYLQPGQNGLITLLLVPTRGETTVFADDTNGNWIIQGKLPWEFSQCQAFHRALQAGQFQWAPSLRKDLQIAEQRIEMNVINHKIYCPKK